MNLKPNEQSQLLNDLQTLFQLMIQKSKTQYKDVATQIISNTEIERQYNNLNSVDRYVIDHHKKFERGLALENIEIEGYKATGLSKKLASTCDRLRIRKGKYQKLIEDNPDIYGSIYCQSKQVTLFKLKPRDQIPQIYELIEYLKINE